MTETWRLQRELGRRALSDEATGLANAALFLDRTTAALGRPDGSGHVGVLVFGLGALVAVASTLGDAAGDAVVAEAARRLRARCSDEETLARLGGGHFGILCESGDRHGVLRLAASVVANAELRRSLLEAFETEQALRGAMNGGQLHLVYLRRERNLQVERGG